MVSLQRKEQIAESLRHLTEIYRSNLTEYEHTLARLSALLELETPPLRGMMAAEPPLASLLADTTTFCAYYRGRYCYLGNTLTFGLFKILADRVNRYVPYYDLLSEVWKREERSGEAIRNAVKQLRKKLAASGMSDVADAIDGSNRGHYGLILAPKK